MNDLFDQIKNQLEAFEEGVTDQEFHLITLQLKKKRNNRIIAFWFLLGLLLVVLSWGFLYDAIPATHSATTNTADALVTSNHFTTLSKETNSIESSDHLAYTPSQTSNPADHKAPRVSRNENKIIDLSVKKMNEKASKKIVKYENESLDEISNIPDQQIYKNKKSHKKTPSQNLIAPLALADLRVSKSTRDDLKTPSPMLAYTHKESDKPNGKLLIESYVQSLLITPNQQDATYYQTWNLKPLSAMSFSIGYQKPIYQKLHILLKYQLSTYQLEAHRLTQSPGDFYLSRLETDQWGILSDYRSQRQQWNQRAHHLSLSFSLPIQLGQRTKIWIQSGSSFLLYNPDLSLPVHNFWQAAVSTSLSIRRWTIGPSVRWSTPWGDRSADFSLGMWDIGIQVMRGW